MSPAPSEAPRASGGAGLLAERPVPHEGVSSSGGADGILLTTADGVRLTLNDTAAALWELCDGRTTVGEMVEAAAALFDRPSEEIQNDVTSVLEALVDQRYLDWR